MDERDRIDPTDFRQHQRDAGEREHWVRRTRRDQVADQERARVRKALARQAQAKAARENKDRHAQTGRARAAARIRRSASEVLLES